MIQRINTTNRIGLQADLTTLRQSFKALTEAWENDKVLHKLQIDQLRINPLNSEQHATTFQKITVIRDSSVPVGQIQAVVITPF